MARRRGARRAQRHRPARRPAPRERRGRVRHRPARLERGLRRERRQPRRRRRRARAQGRARAACSRTSARSPARASTTRWRAGRRPTAARGSRRRGRELYEPALAVTTRYTLHAPDRALLLETTIENTGDAADRRALARRRDAVGRRREDRAGQAARLQGPSSGPYVGGVGRFTSYALTSTEGAIDAVSGSSWTDTAQRKAVKLAPGEKVAVRARLRRRRARRHGEPRRRAATLGRSAVGTLGSTPRGGRRPRSPRCRRARPSARCRPGRERRGGADASRAARRRARGRLPAGRWQVAYAGGGGRAGGATPRSTSRPVRRGAARPRREPPGRSDVPLRRRRAAPRCRARSPSRAPAARPRPTSVPPTPPAPRATRPRRRTACVEVAARRRARTASRRRAGPEYALAQADVRLEPGDAKAARPCAAARASTRGATSACDFHQHTMLGTDAPVATRDRVIANVAEGVEVAVASEHNVVADLEPHRARAAPRARARRVAGRRAHDATRAATPGATPTRGPLRVDPAEPRGGAPVVRDRHARARSSTSSARRARATSSSRSTTRARA